MQAQPHQSGQRPCSELNKLVSLAILYIPRQKPQKCKFLRLLYFFIFLGGGGLKFAASCKMVFRRGRSFARSPMSQTKVTVQKHLKFRPPFQRWWESKGQSPWSPPQRRNPQRILTNKAKVTVKPNKSKKSKSAMQLKKVKPREVTKATILVKRLICIALILYY